MTLDDLLDAILRIKAERPAAGLSPVDVVLHTPDGTATFRAGGVAADNRYNGTVTIDAKADDVTIIELDDARTAFARHLPPPSPAPRKDVH